MRIIKKIIMKIIGPYRKKRRMRGLSKYGHDVVVGKNCTFLGNIECGNHVFINDGAYLSLTEYA